MVKILSDKVMTGPPAEYVVPPRTTFDGSTDITWLPPGMLTYCSPDDGMVRVLILSLESVAPPSDLPRAL